MGVTAFVVPFASLLIYIVVFSHSNRPK